MREYRREHAASLMLLILRFRSPIAFWAMLSLTLTCARMRSASAQLIFTPRATTARMHTYSIIFSWIGFCQTRDKGKSTAMAYKIIL